MKGQQSMPVLEVQTPYQFQWDSLTHEEIELFRLLPADYQAFLMTTNGGILNTPNKWFSVPIERVLNERIFSKTWNTVEQLWAYISYKNTEPDKADIHSILHEHMDHHVGEKFLPQGVYAIGLCLQNSLLWLSTNQHDFGTIYYWEWYWQYPWYKAFFARRIENVALQFPNIEEILHNSAHPLYVKVYNALNYATLMKVSNSFTDFINNLLPEEATENNEE